MKPMQEYKIKVRDKAQNITHTLHQLAPSRKEANKIALDWLVVALRSRPGDLQLVR